MKTDIDLLASLVVQLELMAFTLLFRKCVDVYLKSECLYLPSIINVLMLLHQHAKKLHGILTTVLSAQCTDCGACIMSQHIL